MESNRNYTGTMKSMLAGGLISLAAAGCGDAFETSSVNTGDAGADTTDAGGAGGSAGEGGLDATGGKAGAGGNDAGGGDTGGAGGQPCEVTVTEINVGGEYVDKGQQNVQMLCFTVQANCEATLDQLTVEEQYMTSPTNGILSNGSLWIKDQVVKSVLPVTGGVGKNTLFFSNFSGTIHNGELTEVCVAGDIREVAGGNAKLVINQGGLKTTPANSAGAIEGNQFTVNPS